MADLVRGYFYQLTVGCDRVDCSNPACRSCPMCAVTCEDLDDIALFALRVAASEGGQVLCPGISPRHMYPAILDTANAFTALIRAFHRNPVFDDSMAPIIASLFDSKDAFSYIFLANDDRLSLTNLAIDPRDVTLLTSVISRHARVFEGFAPRFRQLLVDQSLAPFLTFRAIRSILLSFCFVPFLCGATPCPEFCTFLERLDTWPQNARQIFYAVIASQPALLAQALFIAQSNLTVWSLSVPRDDADLVEERVLESIPRSIATFIQYLKMTSQHCTASFEWTAFVNEPLNILVTPASIHHSLRLHREWTYLSAPSVLALAFRSSVLHQWHRLRQDRQAEFEFNRRQGNVTLHDLYLYIEVSRLTIVHDTLIALQRLDSTSLTKGLKIVFKGEQGEDAGGVSREFFYLLCNDAFSPNYGLFNRIHGGKYWFRSDPLQTPIYYNILGTIVALAMYNGIVLPVRFPRLLYKKLCGHALGDTDLAELAPEVAESFASLREMRNEGENVAECGLKFAIALDRLDSGDPIYRLKEGGESITVTNSNLDEYIRLYSDYLMNGSIGRAYELFERGFRKLSQQDEFLGQLFQYDEIDLVISGVDVLDWSQLRLNARYANGYNPESTAVQWFWEVFDEMTDEQKRWLLRFATGTDRTPVTGLTDVRLVIQRSGDPEKLPVAHTCFNVFSLPDYPSKEILARKVLIAIENNEGFGII
jgi:hypothetical protein